MADWTWLLSLAAGVIIGLVIVGIVAAVARTIDKRDRSAGARDEDAVGRSDPKSDASRL